jgi:nitronate monooxygenase
MNTFQKNLCQLLGLQLPLIQAPMAGVQGSALAIAVSEAGGLGSLPCAMLSPDQICAEIETIRTATDRPYNLNFFCHPPPASEHSHTRARSSMAQVARALLRRARH